jgi:hypothetical protein
MTHRTKQIKKNKFRLLTSVLKNIYKFTNCICGWNTYSWRAVARRTREHGELTNVQSRKPKADSFEDRESTFTANKSIHRDQNVKVTTLLCSVSKCNLNKLSERYSMSWKSCHGGGPANFLCFHSSLLESILEGQTLNFKKSVTSRVETRRMTFSKREVQDLRPR